MLCEAHANVSLHFSPLMLHIEDILQYFSHLLN